MGTRQRPRSRHEGRIVLALLAVSVVTARAADPDVDAKAQGARLQFFEQKVRPLLAENCYSCHGPDKQKGGLRLDSREAILGGGESGPALTPGKPEESLLLDAVNHEGLEMPPDGKLEPGQIAVLTRWVALGAPWTTAAGVRAPRPRAASRRPLFSDKDRSLWSLQPLLPPGPAESAGATCLGPGDPWSNWPRNTIDRFVLKRLLEKGLTPAQEADRRTLIRRATFDLTGLPPTPEAIDAFLADQDEGAYERLIDRLLASPTYGQRWGRHWLDLVRYAESDGHRQDAYRPAAWLYRDYVIRSLNADKPYDRFLTEQLAGDELNPDDPEMRIAAGYLRLGPYEFNQRNVRGQWADILNDITDVTGEAFLGLSIGCARCHDHKFDPILQKDYYRLQAFFTPLLPRDDLTLARPREWADYQARLAAWEDATADLRRQVHELEEPARQRAAEDAIAKFPDDIKAVIRKAVSDRTPLEIQLAYLADRQVTLEYDREPALKGQDKARRDELRRRLARLDALKPTPPPAVMTVTDVGPVAPPTVIPGARKAEPIAPGCPSILDPAPAAIDPVPASSRSTGRRLALAHWLTRPDNPLSTRVIVNRVWQYHFGRGIVATSSDFGRLGETPSHPELLDWLAGRFVAGGWRLKPLHRLIMTSAAYRQSAERAESEVEAARRVDPDNRLLWKRTVLRLDAEEIRDAMLAASGELSPALGGPAEDPRRSRRAIETKVIRNSRDPLLDTFDAPDGFASTGRRNITTTPTQALLLINGSWGLDRARALTGRLESRGDTRSRIAQAFRLAYGREPEPDEILQAAAFLTDQARRVSPTKVSAEREAIVDFCHALLNSNEFLYVD